MAEPLPGAGRSEHRWDGELARLPLRHGCTLVALGIPVRFGSNDARVIEIAREAWAGWAEAGTSPDAAPVQITVLVRPRRRQSEPGPEVAPVVHHRIEGPHRIHFESPSGWALSEPDERRGRAVIDAGWLEHEAAFRHGLLQGLTLAVLTGLDRQPLHASAVTRHGVALLLAGEGGVGKSTLAYAATRDGFDLLSEDTVYLQVRPRLLVWGTPGPLHLPAEQRTRFPELAALKPRLLPSGKTKVRVQARPHVGAVVPAEAARICLLRRRDGPPGLAPVSTDEVVSSLLEGLESGFDRFRATLGEPLAVLARGGGYRLDLPSDPRDAVPWLHRLVDELSMRVDHPIRPADERRTSGHG